MNKKAVDGERLLRRMRPVLGTYVEIAVRASAGAEAALDKAFAAITDIHDRLGFHDADSELTRLNRAGPAGLTLSRHAVRVLRLARTLGRVSGDLFNATVGGALVRRGVLPDHGGSALLDSGSYADICIDGRHVSLLRPVRITLDGLAKGYAVDLAVAALRQGGASAGWVNAGGDLRVFGEITLPVTRRELDGRHRPLGGVRNAALASSAVQPLTGADFPALLMAAARPCPVGGVYSVLANSAWRADALTKIAAAAAACGQDAAAVTARLGGRLLHAESSNA